MKTRVHWKLYIAFVITPILALSIFFPVYLKLKIDNEIPATNILLPLSIFGLVGFWLLLTAIMRAKIIRVTSTTIIIKRIISLKRSEYKSKDILSKSISFVGNYRILHFKTRDGIVHSILSYELQNFSKIKQWVWNTDAKIDKVGVQQFIIHEYGRPFIIGLIITLTLLLELRFN